MPRLSYVQFGFPYSSSSSLSLYLFLFLFLTLFISLTFTLFIISLSLLQISKTGFHPTSTVFKFSECDIDFVDQSSGFFVLFVLLLTHTHTHKHARAHAHTHIVQMTHTRRHFFAFKYHRRLIIVFCLKCF